MTMRIRQVRPEFWTDETLAALPDAARLFYIGLWGIADDAGWFQWQPRQIGALLYPYRNVRRRGMDIATWSEQLVKDGRLRLLDCGCGHIPTLSRHQRITGKQSFTNADRHFSKHVVLTDKQSVLSGSPVTERNVKERNVGMSIDFDEAFAAAGGKKP